ncbi:MAG: UDP-N-acetylmuramate dehydrogenase, partial [Gaiellaceae bacterium]
MNEHVSLARKTTMGTGGDARYFAEVATLEDVARALRLAEEKEVELAVIGLGSNMLVSDEGFPGMVVRLVGELATVTVEGSTLRAGGGASLAVCLHRAREAALGGLEFACAIPGTVGGGVWMNAGAYGGNVAGVLARALVVDRDGASWRSVEELGFTYRHSELRHGEVVVQAEFTLANATVEGIRTIVSQMQAARKAAQPTNRRTFGSVFKNPRDDLGAGAAIEQAGLKGQVLGGAQISPKHANFIENAGAATTADALGLIRMARDRVQAKFSVELETEVEFLGPASGEQAWPPEDMVRSRAQRGGDA